MCLRLIVLCVCVCVLYVLSLWIERRFLKLSETAPEQATVCAETRCTANISACHWDQV